MTSQPRRPKGEGVVWKTTAGHWRGQIELPRQAGKRKRVHVKGRTKGEVVNALARIRVKSLDGELTEPTAITVAEYMAHWLKTSGSRTITPSTAEGYERYIRLHIVPAIGQVRLQKLTNVTAELVVANCAGSQRTKQQALAILRKALDQAVRWKLIPRNVCDDIDRPRVQAAQIHPLDVQQTLKFYKAIRGHDLESWFVLALGTGARTSELLALQVTDFHQTSGTLSIQRALATVGKTLVVKNPKSKAGRRRITLDARSIAALQSQLKRRMKTGRAGFPWLFCDDAGGFLDRFAILREFRRILKAAKLPAIRLHDLRHTHASLLLLAGVNPKVVQERLGHSSVAFTLTVYSHFLGGIQDEAAIRFDKLLG